MTEVKHTPGPWKVFTVQGGPNKGQLLGVGQETGEGVADAFGGLWGSGDEKMANARLIAAAPDFFDHAKSLVEAWDARTTGDQQIITGKSDREIQKQAMDAIDGLRAALARARGEQDGGGE